MDIRGTGPGTSKIVKFDSTETGARQRGDGRTMKSALQVMKFGGTSVGDAAFIARAAQIITEAARAGKCVSVVSVMGGVYICLFEASKYVQLGHAQASLAHHD